MMLTQQKHDRNKNKNTLKSKTVKLERKDLDIEKKNQRAQKKRAKIEKRNKNRSKDSNYTRLEQYHYCNKFNKPSHKTKQYAFN